MPVLFRILNSCFALALVIISSLLPAPALANDHGGGSGGPEPMIFTVNLGTENYLQFGIVFEAASPEAEHLIAAYKPKIQHQIILLLSSKNADNLRTLAGKKELIEEIVDLSNTTIDESPKTGVKEVLFTKFLIQ